MIRAAIFGGLSALVGCGADETLTRYDSSGVGVFVLQSIDGVAYPARATLDIREPGQLSGTAPCNSYSATQSVPYPWFEAGPIIATRRACPDLSSESRYFTALSEMQFAEFLGNTLLLTNEAGRSLEFQASP